MSTDAQTSAYESASRKILAGDRESALQELAAALRVAAIEVATCLTPLSVRGRTDFTRNGMSFSFLSFWSCLMNRIFSLAFPLVLATASLAGAATVIAPTEDVMTSGFFQGTNLVRGYSGDGRDVHRVSTTGAFGTPAAEIIYLNFDSADFARLSAPVSSATITLESISGGFGADASTAAPFAVSAHAVDSDPLTSITDDTNPTGPIDWITFFNDNILPADSTASTVVEGFGAVHFDVTTVVNDWLSGANTVFALAITGKNDLSGGDFLHGFVNNTQTPGSTFLTVTQVPEPSSLLFLLCSFVISGCICQPLWRNRRRI